MCGTPPRNTLGSGGDALSHSRAAGAQAVLLPAPTAATGMGCSNLCHPDHQNITPGTPITKPHTSLSSPNAHSQPQSFLCNIFHRNPIFFFWPRLEGEVWDPNQPCAASPELPADQCCPWQPPAMLCPAWPPELSCDSKTAPTKATSLHKPKHRLQRRGGHGLSAFGSPWRHNRCKEQGNASWFCSLHEKQLW